MAAHVLNGAQHDAAATREREVDALGLLQARRLADLECLAAVQDQVDPRPLNNEDTRSSWNKLNLSTHGVGFIAAGMSAIGLNFGASGFGALCTFLVGRGAKALRGRCSAIFFFVRGGAGGASSFDSSSARLSAARSE